MIMELTARCRRPEVGQGDSKPSPPPRELITPHRSCSTATAGREEGRLWLTQMGEQGRGPQRPQQEQPPGPQKSGWEKDAPLPPLHPTPRKLPDHQGVAREPLFLKINIHTAIYKTKPCNNINFYTMKYTLEFECSGQASVGRLRAPWNPRWGWNRGGLSFKAAHESLRISAPLALLPDPPAALKPETFSAFSIQAQGLPQFSWELILWRGAGEMRALCLSPHIPSPEA